MFHLRWPPIYTVIHERAREGDRLLWVVVPFVKLDALKRLLDSAPPATEFKIICRWRPADLVARVSDLEIFGYLQERGCELFINHQIHLKLYVFASNVALSTSGNLTLSGLGYSDSNRANIEVGSLVELTAPDWVNLYRVVSGSRLVTPEVYSRFEEFVKSQPPPSDTVPCPDLLGPPKTYTLASLPATQSPDDLATFYFDPAPSGYTPEVMRRAFHDLAIFEIPPLLSRENFEAVLGAAFRKSAFVVDFLKHLRFEIRMHFGAVNAWIHEKCEDVPLPYRWEIKSNTHSFYNWLAYFIPEVSWDRPNYSQVIYWNEN